MDNQTLQALQEQGQSIWLDYIRRSFLDDGGLEEYVDKGVRGVTSNPSIFEKAISEGSEYDQGIAELTLGGKSTREIYETLVVDDIQRACTILYPVYEESEGQDGFVSLEANPHLAYDTRGTIAEVKRLWDLVDRPNLMIKVPATPEGIPAVEELIGQGYNINITLMFSLKQYDQVSEAFISGLEAFREEGGDLSQITSVASFFVSRLDVKLDRVLTALDVPRSQKLKGKIGIANAKMAYQRFLDTFRTERWQRLADQGAQVQRVLYGSTSTKNPAYPDTLYPDSLIGAHTVNTLPPRTLEAFLDHGTVSPSLTQGVDQAQERLDQLAHLGMDLEHITRELLAEGVIKFANSFDELMLTITRKKSELISRES